VAGENGPVLRCPDLDGALRSLAELFAVTPERLARGLAAAAADVEADPDAELARAILPALAANLGRAPAAPSRIHFFHGTRAFDPGQFARGGLLPLSAVLDDLWARLQKLAPEIPPERFAVLRAGLEDGGIQALTYKERVDGHDDGPNGVLVRDILLHPRDYGSSQFARIPEIVEDICLAACNELRVDLESRFEQAATPCIVEFAAPAPEFEKAITAVCWYAEAALRGKPAGGDDPFWNFDGEGGAVPAEDIIAVEIVP
jgi:hypothetical protein